VKSLLWLFTRGIDSHDPVRAGVPLLLRPSEELLLCSLGLLAAVAPGVPLPLTAFGAARRTSRKPTGSFSTGTPKAEV